MIIGFCTMNKSHLLKNTAQVRLVLGFFFSVILLPLYPRLSWAADTQPIVDKSTYSLFNPTPNEQMRGFATDRPTKSDTPYTVDAGHIQYEADFMNWTYDRYNSASLTSSALLVADPVLKLGLTNRTDLELALSPLNFDYTKNRASGARNVAFGFGDVNARLKVNLVGNDGGDYILAVVPYIKAPTAMNQVGNNHWEGGGYMPFVVLLPEDWTLNLTTELDILDNSAQNGYHKNFQNLINLSHPLFTDALTGYVEFWSDVNNDQSAATQYTADFALSWTIRDNFQLDAGVNLGLNKAANDAQLYLGISQRF